MESETTVHRESSIEQYRPKTVATDDGVLVESTGYRPTADADMIACKILMF